AASRRGRARSRMKCAVALVLLAGSPAYADWNVGVYLGIPYTLSSPLRLQLSPGTDVVFESVAYRGEPFTFPLYYGYRAGYFSNHLGIEAELIHLKVFADPSEVVGRDGRIAGRT